MKRCFGDAFQLCLFIGIIGCSNTTPVTNEMNCHCDAGGDVCDTFGERCPKCLLDTETISVVLESTDSNAETECTCTEDCSCETDDVSCTDDGSSDTGLIRFLDAGVSVPCFSDTDSVDTVCEPCADAGISDCHYDTADSDTEECPDLRYESTNVFTVGAMRRMNNDEVSQMPLLVEDLDDDGDLDMVIPSSRTDVISIFEGDGTGQFTPRFELETCDWPIGAALANMDNDGLSDIVVVCRQDSAVHIRLDDSFGYFLNETLGVPFDGTRLESGRFIVQDVIGDTRPEIIVTAVPKMDPSLGEYYQTSGGSELWIIQGHDYYSLSSIFVDTASGIQAFLQWVDIDSDGEDELFWAGNIYSTVIESEADAGVETDEDDRILVASESLLVEGGCRYPGGIVDLNHDGVLDMVCPEDSGSNANHYLTSYLGSFDGGTWQLTEHYSQYMGIFKAALDFGDVNGDGDVDVVVNSNNISTFIGNGDGTFADPKLNSPLSAFHQPLKLADFNRDSVLDLVTTHEYLSDSGGVTVSFGDGTGRFYSDIYLMDHLDRVLGADVGRVTDMESRLTVVLNDRWDYETQQHYLNIHTYKTDENGALQEMMHEEGWPFYIGSGGSSIHRMRLFDADGDGNDDLAYIASNTVYLSTYEGDGQFGTPVSIAARSGVSALLSGNVNGDDREDLVVKAGNSILLIASQDATSWHIQIFTVEDISDFNVGDVNGDDLDDIVIVGSSGSNAVVRGARTGNLVDELLVASITNPDDLAIGDMNGDGVDEVLVYQAGDTPGYNWYNITDDNRFAFVESSTFIDKQYTTPLLTDFNEDGYLDAVFASWTDYRVRLLKGDGTGSLYEHSVLDVFDAGWKILAYDQIVGDNTKDLLVHNDDSDKLLLLNGIKTTEACGVR